MWTLKNGRSILPLFQGASPEGSDVEHSLDDVVMVVGAALVTNPPTKSTELGPDDLGKRARPTA